MRSWVCQRRAPVDAVYTDIENVIEKVSEVGKYDPPVPLAGELAWAGDRMRRRWDGTESGKSFWFAVRRLCPSAYGRMSRRGVRTPVPPPLCFGEVTSRAWVIYD